VWIATDISKQTFFSPLVFSFSSLSPRRGRPLLSQAISPWANPNIIPGWRPVFMGILSLQVVLHVIDAVALLFASLSRNHLPAVLSTYSEAFIFPAALLKLSTFLGQGEGPL
jgi:hypothetical protein